VSTIAAQVPFSPTAVSTRQASAAFLFRYTSMRDMLGARSFVPPATATFTDVPVGHTFFREIEWMASRGLASGYGDGSFRPSGKVSRQAFAVFLYRLAQPTSFVAPSTPTFSDVGVSHPFRVELEWKVAEGVGAGFSDGTFRPTTGVSRQAAASWLFNFYWVSDR